MALGLFGIGPLLEKQLPALDDEQLDKTLRVIVDVLLGGPASLDSREVRRRRT